MPCLLKVNYIFKKLPGFTLVAYSLYMKKVGITLLIETLLTTLSPKLNFWLNEVLTGLEFQLNTWVWFTDGMYKMKPDGVHCAAAYVQSHCQFSGIEGRL